MSQKSAHYRPDIDGLRAIAVSAVLLFHAFPKLAPGGFAGVDIFFVISGFLISGVILNDLRRDRFRYVDFYARRVRRIFPALTLVLAACLVLGWMVAFPIEYQALGKHVIAGAGFISNLVLWRESGYFDVASENKPLLHLWSLGIEEQFYIVWPIVLAVLFRRFKSGVKPLLALALASFALNIAFFATRPSDAFYLPFTRFWELLAGSLLAWVTHNAGTSAAPVMTRRVRNVAALTGCALLVLALAMLDSRAGFPGWWALTPVAGAWLVIAAGPEAWFNRTVLSHPWVVFIGLISYPLYLWHWPLLTFARLVELGGMSAGVRAGLLGCSVALAWATYRFLENPIRFGKLKHQSPAWILLSLAAVSLCGGAVYVRHGRDVRLAKNSRIDQLEQRVPTRAYVPCSGALRQLRGDGAPPIDWCMQSTQEPATAVVFGDSHAEHLFHGLAHVDQGRSWALVGHNSCPPVNGIDIEGAVTGCRDRTERITQALARSPELQVVVLSFFGNYFLDSDLAADHIANHHGPTGTRIRAADGSSGSKEELFFAGLERTVDLLERAGKSVVIVIDVPELPFFPVNRLRFYLASQPGQAVSLSKQAVLDRQSRLRAHLALIEGAHPRLKVYDPLEFLCDSSACYWMEQGSVLFKDSHHLSYAGSVMFAEHFLKSGAFGSAVETRGIAAADFRASSVYP